jgi:hypothetical protein
MHGTINMSTQKGCKFCIRYGLPLLPVRPAVVARDDALPIYTGSVTIPNAGQLHGRDACCVRVIYTSGLSQVTAG